MWFCLNFNKFFGKSKLFLLYTFRKAEEAVLRFLKPPGKLMDE